MIIDARMVKIQMSHLLLYLKSCVNYIHFKIFKMSLSSFIVFHSHCTDKDNEVGIPRVHWV